MKKTEEKINKGRKLKGIVVSNKMEKSVRVKVETKKPHPMYGKIIKSHKSYIAHDEENKCQIGDIVEIQEVRPISKRKSWMVININSKQV